MALFFSPSVASATASTSAPSTHNAVPSPSGKAVPKHDAMLQAVEALQGSVLTITEAPEVEVHAPKIQPMSVSVEETETQVLTEAWCDEYIQLHQKWEQLEGKKLLDRMNKLKSDLQLIANQSIDKDQVAVFSSALGEIEFSKRSTVKEISDTQLLVSALVEKLGSAAAFSCVKIGMSELKRLLSENEMKHYVQETPGSRTLKEVRLAS